MDHVRDWDAAFHEFSRVLRRDGHFVFSAGHPSDEFYDHHPAGDYFEVEPVDLVWGGFGTPVRVPCYRRRSRRWWDAPRRPASFLNACWSQADPAVLRSRSRRNYKKLMRNPASFCFPCPQAAG